MRPKSVCLCVYIWECVCVCIVEATRPSHLFSVVMVAVCTLVKSLVRSCIGTQVGRGTEHFLPHIHC